MSDTKDNSLLAVQGSIHFGFLTIYQDTTGFVGAYLATNRWLRPLEFRISSAVSPNKVQQILYGDSLRPFLFAEVIAKALIEKSSNPVNMVITDQPEVLELRKKMDLAVACLTKAETVIPEGYQPITGPRGIGLIYSGKSEDIPAWSTLFENMDFDLAEPFIRIRDAVSETRRTTNRTTGTAAPPQGNPPPPSSSQVA